jgi:hypothetical protein
VRCTVRAASGTRAKLRLVRHGRTVRTLRARVGRGGTVSFDGRGLRGRHTLVVEAGARSGRAVLRLG